MDRTRRCNRYLPEDIIFIVLLWLPIKKLFQFKSVCKSWRSMISSNVFIQDHLTNSHKKRAFLLNCKPVKYNITESNNNYMDVHYTPQDSYRVNLPPTIAEIEYIFSCDGLVCLSNEKCDVAYLWNPSTKQVRMLPAPNKNMSGSQVSLGLGFDSISNDYKLLRIGFRWPRGIRAELYSSQANSWKDIQIPRKIRKLDMWPSKIVHVKPGILYLDTRPKILAFKLHEEVFRQYPFPPGFILSNLLDFEGYIAMAMESRDKSAQSHSLFVLNDVCGKLSWTKLFNLDLKITRIYRYLGTWEFLVNFRYEKGIYFYDYQTRETKKCNLRRSLRGSCAPIKYTESLVSVKGWV